MEEHKQGTKQDVAAMPSCSATTLCARVFEPAELPRESPSGLVRWNVTDQLAVGSPRSPSSPRADDMEGTSTAERGPSDRPSPSPDERTAVNSPATSVRSKPRSAEPSFHHRGAEWGHRSAAEQWRRAARRRVGELINVSVSRHDPRRASEATLLRLRLDRRLPAQQFPAVRLRWVALLDSSSQAACTPRSRCTASTCSQPVRLTTGAGPDLASSGLALIRSVAYTLDMAHRTEGSTWPPCAL